MKENEPIHVQRYMTCVLEIPLFIAILFILLDIVMDKLEDNLQEFGTNSS